MTRGCVTDELQGHFFSDTKKNNQKNRFILTACLPHTIASATYICLSLLNSLALTRSLSLTHMYTVLSAGVQGLSLCKRSDRLADWPERR